MIPIWDTIVAAKSAIITGVAVFALTLPVGYCTGHRAASNKAAAERALASVAAVKLAKEANEQAAGEHVADALRIAEKEKDLVEAIADQPDSQPSAVRVAAACQRLRAQGTDPTTLPEVCGHPSGN